MIYCDCIINSFVRSFDCRLKKKVDDVSPENDVAEGVKACGFFSKKKKENKKKAVPVVAELKCDNSPVEKKVVQKPLVQEKEKVPEIIIQNDDLDVNPPNFEPKEHITRCYSGIQMLAEDDEKSVGQSSLSIAYQDALQRHQSIVDEFLLEVDQLGGLHEFSRSYKNRGLVAQGDGSWTITEWVPNVAGVSVIGEFNGWERPGVVLVPSADGLWSGTIPKSVGLKAGMKYKLHIHPLNGGDAFDQVPAWAYQTVLTESSNLLDAVAVEVNTKDTPPPTQQKVDTHCSPKVYEMHVGLCSNSANVTKGTISTFDDVANSSLLGRIARNGYNTILLLGVLEHREHSTLGVDTSCFFSVCHRIGGMEGLKKFVAAAHAKGVKVLLSLSLQGCLAEDGLLQDYFQTGTKSVHPTHATRMFDFEKTEVLRFLLSNLAYWVDVCGIDGYRFEDVPSVLYSHFGGKKFLPQDTSKKEDYFNSSLRQATLKYLTLANILLHSLREEPVLTIVEDSSLFPGLCLPVAEGGVGFDVRQSSSLSKCIHHFADEKKDEEWNIDTISNSVLNEKELRPAESFAVSPDTLVDSLTSRRPLKIALLSWETLHTISVGGVAPHVSELASMLHHAGHDVHIFTRSTKPESWTHEVWGVTYHEVAYGLDKDFVNEIRNMCSSFVEALLGFEELVGERFDIIHGHDWLAGPAVEGFKALGRRTVFTMHSTEFGRCGNQHHAAGESPRIREIEAAACHAADRVIAVSGVLAGEVKDFYQTHPEKIQVIYNGIHARPFLDMVWKSEWVGNTKRDLGIGVMDPFFLFVGRLAVQKGPDLLLEAIPQVLAERPDAKFVFVGDGHLKGSMEQKVGAMGIGHAVRFTGPIKSGSDHLKALFRSCDAVVVPSRNEPFGIVVLEAWVAGKPVVATTRGGPRDFVTPEKNGFLVDPDPGSIAWGCKAILGNFDHARWMGGVAQKKAVDSFSWEAIAQNTEQVYYEQLSLHGAPARRTTHQQGSLMHKFMGVADGKMRVSDKSHLIDRAMSLHKLVRCAGFAVGDAFVTAMGGEFGYADLVDVPRPANNFSGRVFDMSLPFNTALRYKHLEFFEACLLRLESYCGFLQQPVNIILSDVISQVLVVSRGGVIFVLHFSPTAQTLPYHIGFEKDTKLTVLFDSEEKRFGGHRAKPRIMTPTLKNGGFVMALAARSVLVLATAPLMDKLKAEKYQEDAIIELQDADVFAKTLILS